MAIITTNTSRLPVVQKCARGATIISLSTDNPRVPGNDAARAAFSAIQDDLVAANLAVELARDTLAEALSRRDDAEKRWDRGIAQFAGLTEALANSDPTAILSTGFGVRGVNAKPQPLPAPEGVKALTNGFPGRTKLTWEGVEGAVIYLIEMSLDPDQPVNWNPTEPTTRTTCEVDGAEPGQHAWFRVAAVNAAGQGPWSTPALRPVM
jgi:hypothetical protein